MPALDTLITEFANTLAEWHYFVGGGALGFTIGLILGLYLAFRFSVEHHEAHDEDL